MTPVKCHLYSQYCVWTWEEVEGGCYGAVWKEKSQSIQNTVPSSLPKLKGKISYSWQRLYVVNNKVHLRCSNVSNSWFFRVCVVSSHCRLTLRVLLTSQPQAQAPMKRLKIVPGPVNDFNELSRKTTGNCARGGCGGILNASVQQQQHERQNRFSLLLLSSTQLLRSMKELWSKVRSCFLIPRHFRECYYKSKILSQQAVCVNPVCLLQPGREDF